MAVQYFHKSDANPNVKFSGKTPYEISHYCN